MRNIVNSLATLNRISLLVFGLCLFSISSTAYSASRQALVIGNSNYGSGHGLVTPLNDSTAIADKLAAIGYQVHGGGAQLDLNLDQFNNEIDAFLSSCLLYTSPSPRDS